MSRTIESIVDSHDLATTRRKAGRPIWDGKFDVSDVFHNAALTFEQRRDAIASRLIASAWARDSRTVYDLADELADVQNSDEFDDVWDLIYDEADYDQIQVDRVCEWPVSPGCDRNNPTTTRHGQPICGPCNTHLDASAAKVAERVAQIRGQRASVTERGES